MPDKASYDHAIETLQADRKYLLDEIRTNNILAYNATDPKDAQRYDDNVNAARRLYQESSIELLRLRTERDTF